MTHSNFTPTPEPAPENEDPSVPGLVLSLTAEALRNRWSISLDWGDGGALDIMVRVPAPRVSGPGPRPDFA